jgi:hypothetical protein
MDIAPDTKDWTWVLQRPCPECGLDASRLDRRDIPGIVRENALSWQRVLAVPGVRHRPSSAVWSALEYGCHVRDVFRLYDARLVLMLTTEDPLYPNWDQDVTAVEERYGEQDPATVAQELMEAAEAIATRFEHVSEPQWQRTGSRTDGATFTVDSFARYFVHDPVHHLHDVNSAAATRLT